MVRKSGHKESRKKCDNGKVYARKRCPEKKHYCGGDNQDGYEETLGDV